MSKKKTLEIIEKPLLKWSAIDNGKRNPYCSAQSTPHRHCSVHATPCHTIAPVATQAQPLLVRSVHATPSLLSRPHRRLVHAMSHRLSCHCLALTSVLSPHHTIAAQSLPSWRREARERRGRTKRKESKPREKIKQEGHNYHFVSNFNDVTITIVN